MVSILIIDDQPLMCELLSEVFAEEGYRTHCIGDSDLLVKAMDECKPDIVLLDLYLDGFEGWDLLKEIKRQKPGVPVIIVSAYDTFTEDPRLKIADGYFIKNIHVNPIVEKVNHLLDVSQQVAAKPV